MDHAIFKGERSIAELIKVGAVGTLLGYDAGLGAHGGAADVALLAIGAALVAGVEAPEGAGRRRCRCQNHGHEQECHYSHLHLLVGRHDLDRCKSNDDEFEVDVED